MERDRKEKISPNSSFDRCLSLSKESTRDKIPNFDIFAVDQRRGIRCNANRSERFDFIHFWAITTLLREEMGGVGFEQFWGNGFGEVDGCFGEDGEFASFWPVEWGNDPLRKGKAVSE